MRIDADLIQGEIPRKVRDESGKWVLNPDFPHHGRCQTGHEPAPPVVTRFFAVSGKVMESGEGVYCEYCLALGNYLKRLKKEGKEPSTSDYDAVLKHMLDKAWEKESQYYG